MPLITNLETKVKRLGMCKDLFLDAARDRAPQEDRWFKNEKLFIGYINRLTWPYSSRISVRKIFEYADTELSRFYQATISVNPPFTVNPVSRDDVERANKVKNLLLWQQEVGMEDFPDEWERFILTGIVYGFAPCTMDWTTRYGYVPTLVPYRVRNGKGKGHLRSSRLEPIYTGPEFRARSPYEIYLRSSTIRPRESYYLFDRLLVSYDDLMELQEQGLLENVEKLKNKDSSLVNTDFTERINNLLGRSVGLQWMDYDKDRDIEIIYGWFPRENYYMIMAGGSVMLYEGPIPYLNAEIPYEFWTNFLNLWHWCGWSSPELLEDQQHEINFLKNARADNRNKQLMPQFMRLRGAMIRDEDLFWSPFGRIDTNNMAGLKQLEITDTWSQTSLVEEKKCDEEMENTVGLADVRRGVQPAPRESATSVTIRSEASSVRMGHRNQRLLNVYKRILRKQHRYNRQFMRKSEMVRVLGEEIKGYVEVTPEDVMREYDFVIQPTLAYGNRYLRREELKEFTATVASVPGFQAVMNFAPILKQYMEAYDFRNIDDLINNTREAQMLAMISGKGGSAPSSFSAPESVIGSSGNRTDGRMGGFSGK